MISAFLKLRFTILWRQFNNLPVFYKILLPIFAAVFAFALFKIKVDLTAKNIMLISIIHLFCCFYANSNIRRNLFLQQFPKMLTLDRFVNLSAISIPFTLLVPQMLPIFVVNIAICILIKSLFPKINVSFGNAVLLSPFAKSAYLWNSAFRSFLLPMLIALLALQIIAVTNNNFNLAIAAYLIIACGALLLIFMQCEDEKFVKMYINGNLFSKSALYQTLINTSVFILPAIIVSLWGFAEQWKIILLIAVGIYFVAINLLWIRYAFFYNPIFAFIFFATFVGVQIFLFATLHLFAIPLFVILQYWLYATFLHSVKNIIGNEKIDN